MILLNATTKSLEIALAGAVTTNELDFVTSYVDVAQSNFGASAAAEQDGTSNGTSNVTVLTAPSASTTRQLKELSVYNADTVAATVSVKYNNNGTRRIVTKVTLDPGDTLTVS